MLKNDLIKNLPLTIPKQTPIVIGCSAGPDSMALLHYLKENTPNQLVVAHINHNIREESKEEENYLSIFCQKNNIIFESTTIKKYNENNFENEARNKRYAFYEKILNKYNTTYLFLAHHGDDLIETILMKIVRGSNLEGYAGIKQIAKKNNYYIIRPFLEYTKQDLIKYNEKHNIKYYIDKSNTDTTYTRNRYRKNILPLLKQETENVHKQFLKYSKTLLEYNNYLEEELISMYPKIINNNTLDIKELLKQHSFLQKNLLYKFLNTYYQNQPNIVKEQHIDDIINIINSPKPNSVVHLPKNKIARKSYDYLYLEENTTQNPSQYKILLQEKNTIGNITIEKINNSKTNGNDICRLNSKDISLPLYIRTRKDGDYIEQKGLNGKKKIKEIFIENKIPQNLRNSYPILVDSNDQIIWIPNLKKSKFDRPIKEFCDIILKYCEKEENDEQ